MFQVRPELVSAGHKGRVSTPRLQAGIWEVEVSQAGRYRLAWGVVKQVGGAATKGYLVGEPPTVIDVVDNQEPQILEPVLKEQELEGALRR